MTKSCACRPRSPNCISRWGSDHAPPCLYRPRKTALRRTRTEIPQSHLSATSGRRADDATAGRQRIYLMEDIAADYTAKVRADEPGLFEPRSKADRIDYERDHKRALRNEEG